MKNHICVLLVFTFSLIVSQNTFADTNFNYDSSLSLLAAGNYRKLSSSKFNTKNRALKIADKLVTFEGRPIIKIFYKDSLTFVARPRWITNYSEASFSENQKSYHNSTNVRWSEVNLKYNINDSYFLTYGLQNYQWGPAEAASPSNRIFHDSINVKDVLFETKGRHLLRLNSTPAENLSEVFIAELSDNGEPEFEANEAFAKKVLSKTELSWSGGADYAGIVIGWRDRSGFWLGEYFNYDPIEGLSLYFDMSQQKGSLSWHPVKNSNVSPILLEQSKKNDEEINNYAVIGVKYASENGTDLRGEWIYQDAGYSSCELQNLWKTLNADSLSQLMVLESNAQKLDRLGLEFLGQQYFLVSLRVSDFLNIKNWNFYLREMLSAQDGSSTFYLSSENSAGQSGTIFSSVALTSGVAESDLGGFVSTSLVAGYKHSW